MPAQRHLQLAAFDVTGEDRGSLAELLRSWTEITARLMAGAPLRGTTSATGDGLADSGEAAGLPPGRLTVTLGVGRSLFISDGEDRFGLADHLPAAMRPLPAFAGDALEPGRSDGDLVLQICGDDAQTVSHALHSLTRAAHGAATPRWIQSGFLSAPKANTPRNTLGFKDGSRNIDTRDGSALKRDVWVGPETDQPWMRGGTYLVFRRVRTLLDVWDVTSQAGQEAVIGRQKETGAPLGGHREHEAPRFDLSAIPTTAHIRLAAPEQNGGARLLRRGFNYLDGYDRETGQIDTGLVFLAFQKDPRAQFVPIQRRLAASDALNKHVVHTGSGLFACPPGVLPGDVLGGGLLAL